MFNARVRFLFTSCGILLYFILFYFFGILYFILFTGNDSQLFSTVLSIYNSLNLVCKSELNKVSLLIVRVAVQGFQLLSSLLRC